MSTLLLIATTAFTAYMAVAVMLFGIPSSLSITYYLYKEKKDALKWLFPVMCLVVAGSLTPYWVEISPPNIQFLPFLACFGLLLVGAAPAFNKGLEKKVHFAGAGLSAIATVLWLCLVGLWLEPTIALSVATILVIIDTIRNKNTLLLWYEMAIFGSLFYGLWIYEPIKQI